MANANYGEQYKDPRWQRKRLEALEAAGWKCHQCADQETTLHVHHKRYIKGRSVWDYKNELLIVLCARCHSDHHDGTAYLHALIAEAEPGYLPSLIGIVSGYLDANLAIPYEVEKDAEEWDQFAYELGLTAAVLEWTSYRNGERDLSAWRSIVREHVAKRKAATPVVRRAIESWDREDGIVG